jgi:adenylosuccinate lyase
MGRVWSDAHKYELWCRVETLVVEAHAEAGTIPAEVVEPVRKAPPPTPEAVHAIEAVTQHDVIAFLTAWADNTEPREAARYVHFGMTSSDLLDTALALQLVEATDILLAKADTLVGTLRDHALAHRATLWAVRTASTASRTCGATGWPTSRSRWRAPATASAAPARPSA